VENKEEIAVELEDDPLTETMQVSDRTTLDRRKGWVNRAQQKRRDQAHFRDALAHNSWAKSVEVKKDVRQFRHGVVRVNLAED
jgi:hypothetical protein